MSKKNYIQDCSLDEVQDKCLKKANLIRTHLRHIEDSMMTNDYDNAILGLETLNNNSICLMDLLKEVNERMKGK